jgi:hypothetical protein
LEETSFDDIGDGRLRSRSRVRKVRDMTEVSEDEK